MRGGEVVQHATREGGVWWRSDGDVEDPSGALVRFQKRQIAHISGYTFFENGDVEEVPRIPEAVELAGDASRWGMGRECSEINAVGCQELWKLGIGMDTHQTRDKCANTSTSDDSWKEICLVEGFHDSEMKQPEYCASLKHQGSATERLACVGDEGEFLLRCKGRKGENFED